MKDCLKARISIDEKLFAKIKFYKAWAFRTKNQKTKLKLIKKAIKEMESLTYETIRSYCKVEMVKEC